MIRSLQRYAGNLEVAVKRSIGRPGEGAPLSRTLPEDPARLEPVIGWLKYENTRNQANIWIRPIPSQPHPWLLLDDLSRNLAYKIAVKYASLLVETTQSIYQCRLLSSYPLDVHSRGQVQSTLVGLLNARGEYADPGSTAGDKWGRLAGFRNRKPGRDCWTNLVLDTTSTSPRFDPTLFLSPRGGRCDSPVFDAQRKHFRYPISHSAAGSDSEREFGWVVSRLKYFYVKGFDVDAEAERLVHELKVNSEKRGKKNATDYARRTIVAALRALECT